MFWRFVWILLFLFCHTCNSWAVRYAIVEVVCARYTLTKTKNPAVLCCSGTCLLKFTVVNVDHTFSAFSEGKAENRYSTHNSTFTFNKTKRHTNFPNLFLSRNSTRFGQFLCPSSGFFHCTFGTGIYHQTCLTYTSAECTVENS